MASKRLRMWAWGQPFGGTKKLVLLALTESADADGWVEADFPYLTTMAGCSRTAASNAVGWLESNNIIAKKASRNGGKFSKSFYSLNITHINPPCSDSAHGGGASPRSDSVHGGGASPCSDSAHGGGRSPCSHLPHGESGHRVQIPHTAENGDSLDLNNINNIYIHTPIPIPIGGSDEEKKNTEIAGEILKFSEVVSVLKKHKIPDRFFVHQKDRQIITSWVADGFSLSEIDGAVVRARKFAKGNVGDIGPRYLDKVLRDSSKQKSTLSEVGDVSKTDYSL